MKRSVIWMKCYHCGVNGLAKIKNIIVFFVEESIEKRLSGRV